MQGARMPSPGKLLLLQWWELPQTVTDLRSFLGITNYFSEYVQNYAEAAAILMSKLQVGRGDGKKGSPKRIEWGEGDKMAFEDLKRRLAQSLCLNQPCLNQPF